MRYKKQSKTDKAMECTFMLKKMGCAQEKNIQYKKVNIYKK